MPYRVLSNKRNGRVVIHCAAANSGNIITAGNSTVSNLASNSTSGEDILGATIRRVKWGTDGRWDLLRGANLVISLTQTGSMDLSEGMLMTLDSAANLVFNTTSANSFLIVEADKVQSGAGFANAGY